MSKWKEYKLGEVCSFVKDKIAIRDVSISEYISTENMLPDKGGITSASSIPMDGMVTRYCPETVLISNIRPYFKKIWFADKEGGCSNDVLCFKGNDVLINSKYLYYLLAQDIFFDYVMLGSKGSKMPRGDKDHIMKWKVSIPPVDEQKRIAGVLSSLDDKIDLLHRENATLEALAETLFRHYFIENPNPDWKEGKLGDVCHYVTDKMETSSLTTISYISTENMLNDKQGVTEASSIPNDIRVTRYGVGDILLSNIRPYFKKIWLADRRGGCSNDVLCIRANEKEFDCFVYYTLRQDDFFDYVMLGSKGCKMPRGDKQHIMNWPICLPNVESLCVFNKPVLLMIQKIKSNQQQIQTLTTKRDTLLPRLMSGEVNVVVH